MRRVGAALAATMLAGAPCVAAPIDQLREFLSATHSARGEFSQEVVGQPGAKTMPRSSGTFEFQRPGRFRWVYAKPYKQLIVSNGERMYLYDQDLNQVTVKRLQGALPASPASILFGSNDFERDFTVSNDGSGDGIDWILALPRAKDSPYERIRIGFRDGLPAAMQLSDSFGQTTRLAFEHVQRNPPLPADTFKFEPPKGADVLEDQ